MEWSYLTSIFFKRVAVKHSINTSRRLESAPGPDTPRRNSALKVPWDLSWQLTPNSLVTSLGTHICIVHSIILLSQDFHVDLLWAWLWLLWSRKWRAFLVKQCWYEINSFTSGVSAGMLNGTISMSLWQLLDGWGSVSKEWRRHVP